MGSKEAKRLFRTQRNTCDTHSRLVYNENSSSETRALTVADPHGSALYRNAIPHLLHFYENQLRNETMYYNPLLVLIITIYCESRFLRCACLYKITNKRFYFDFRLYFSYWPRTNFINCEKILCGTGASAGKTEAHPGRHASDLVESFGFLK